MSYCIRILSVHLYIRQQNVDKLFPTNQDTNININLDIEENSPFQEGVTSETIQRPDKTFFQNPKRLEDLIDTGNLIHKFLPKQTFINFCILFIEKCLKAPIYQ